MSVAISAAVTAYGRIHISRIKKSILLMAGSIYYSDTDSIVTNLELPKQMVDNKALGKLKLEHFVEKGYFIAGKTYCLVLENGTCVIKAKGVEKSSLTLEDFIEMHKGNKITTSLKIINEKDYRKGSVVIKPKNVTLDPLSYIKREKIYHNNIWVDTKPLIINGHDSLSSIAFNCEENEKDSFTNKTVVIYKPKDMVVFEPFNSLIKKKILHLNVLPVN